MHILGKGMRILGKGMHILGKGMHIFGKGMHILGKRMHILGVRQRNEHKRSMYRWMWIRKKGFWLSAGSGIIECWCVYRMLMCVSNLDVCIIEFSSIYSHLSFIHSWSMPISRWFPTYMSFFATGLVTVSWVKCDMGWLRWVGVLKW